MDDPKLAEDTPQQVSRRNFIKGVIATGAAVSSAAYLFRSSSLLWQAAIGTWQRRAVDHAQRERARNGGRRDEAGNACHHAPYKLGLTGTKLGCDRAECGACTVLVDDVSSYSCSMLTHTVREKKIVTIEGWRPPMGHCIRCSKA